MPPRDHRRADHHQAEPEPAANPPRALQLTRRERQILELVARGATNTEIGAELGLTPNTVKTYWQRVLGKLGARNRAHAVARAQQMGLL